MMEQLEQPVAVMRTDHQEADIQRRSCPQPAGPRPAKVGASSGPPIVLLVALRGRWLVVAAGQLGGGAGQQAAPGQPRHLPARAPPITPPVTPQISPDHWPGLRTLPMHEFRSSGL